MAAHVEDHPIEYFDFEGVIPKGEYGGGDVIVWDWGTWEPEETDDPGKAVASGELKFRLHGEKLRGRFVIVQDARLRRPVEDDWLLIHKKDADADPAWDIDALPRRSRPGAPTTRSRQARDAVWDSHAPAAEAEHRPVAARVEAALPEFIQPMLATPVDRPFSDPDWLFEMKLDGYRVEAVVDDGKVRLWTRNKQDAARYFPELAAAKPVWINAEQAIVDGEVVALDEDGNAALQPAPGPRRHGPPRRQRGDRWHGADADPSATRARRAARLPRLRPALPRRPLAPRTCRSRSASSCCARVLRDHPSVRYLAPTSRRMARSSTRSCEQRGLEGIDRQAATLSRYEPGSVQGVAQGQDPARAGAGRRRLRAGQGRPRGPRLALLAALRGQRAALRGRGGQRPRPAHACAQLRDGARRASRGRAAGRQPAADQGRPCGREPRLVVRAEFSEWTTDDYLRQAAFKGLEIGKDPKSVVRERAMPTTHGDAARPRRSRR